MRKIKHKRNRGFGGFFVLVLVFGGFFCFVLFFLSLPLSCFVLLCFQAGQSWCVDSSQDLGQVFPGSWPVGMVKKSCGHSRRSRDMNNCDSLVGIAEVLCCSVFLR